MTNTNNYKNIQKTQTLKKKIITIENRINEKGVSRMNLENIKKEFYNYIEQYDNQEDPGFQ